MKIGIATWYYVLNHGAVLQAVASKRLLENMGHKVTIVGFKSNNHYEPPKRKIKDFLPWVIFPRKRFSLTKETLFKEYIKQNLIIESKNKNQWDVVMVGADEVFSLEGGLTPELFGIDYSCPVFAYAACSGPSTINDYLNPRYKEIISNSLMNMIALGVRDDNTKSIVEALTKKEATLNLDPVLLYGFQNELTSKDNVQRNNICLYAYTFRWDEKEEIKLVKRFAKKRNCRIDSLGFFHRWCNKNINIGPEDLLKEIQHYSFMFTDTFHGTIFAIITHTPFFVKIRNNSPKLISLLKMLKLENRIITDENPVEKIASTSINFDDVDTLLEEYRKESNCFLKDSLLRVENN